MQAPLRPIPSDPIREIFTEEIIAALQVRANKSDRLEERLAVLAAQGWPVIPYCRAEKAAWETYLGAGHTLAPLRWTLVQGAGRIGRHAGQVVLTLVGEAETLALFRGIRWQCWALRGVP